MSNKRSHSLSFPRHEPSGVRMQGRTKKDAKQRAASQILEAVLARMSLQDFLKAPGGMAAAGQLSSMPPSLADSVLAKCMPPAGVDFIPSRIRPHVGNPPNPRDLPSLVLHTK